MIVYQKFCKTVRPLKNEILGDAIRELVKLRSRICLKFEILYDSFHLCSAFKAIFKMNSIML